MGGTVWVLLAFVAWHYESSCGAFLGKPCFLQYWDALRWILLAKWIFPYQTLIGGLAALGAGAFVLIAAKQTARDSKTSEHEKLRRHAIVACSIVADEFRDAQIEIKNIPFDVAFQNKRKAVFVATPAHMPTLHLIDPEIGSIVSATKRDAEEFVSNRTYSPQGANTEAAKCFAIWRLLLFVSENLNHDGSFDFSNSDPIPAGELSRLVSRLSVDPRELIGLYSIFDWSA